MSFEERFIKKFKCTCEICKDNNDEYYIKEHLPIQDVLDFIEKNYPVKTSSVGVQLEVMPKIAGIRWESRYSTTLKDDERGRWMRIGRINGMTVAIILKAKERFLIKLPNNRSDESLENHIIATDLGQGMLEAEKYIAKYVSNFRHNGMKTKA